MSPKYTTIVMLVLIISVSTISLVLCDDDWPMFGHDPEHSFTNDCEMGDEYELLWKYETGGAVLSSPTVVDGMVYVGSWDHCLYCLDAYDGSLEWEYETGDWVSSSPAIVNSRVYFVSNDSYLYCLDTDDGSLEWKYECYMPVGYSSPTVVDGMVYIGSDNSYLYCLDAYDGSLEWKYETGDDIWSSPAVVDGRVYIGSEDSYLYCLDAYDGSLEWKYETGGGIFSSPGIFESRVYFGSNDNYVYCLESVKPLTATPPPTNTKTNENSTLLPIIAIGAIILFVITINRKKHFNDSSNKKGSSP